MDATEAAVRIQQAWRGWWKCRTAAATTCRTLGGGGGCSGSDQDEEAAQATTSGYLSGSSSSSSGSGGGSVGGSGCLQRCHQQRLSWTLSLPLPLNLHRFGDSSGDSSPLPGGLQISVGGLELATGSLSVGASRTDLTLSAASQSPPALSHSLWPDSDCPPEPPMELCYRNDAASDSSDDSGDGSGSGCCSCCCEQEEADGGDDDARGAAGRLHDAREDNDGWEPFRRPAALVKHAEGSQSQQIFGSRSLTRRPLEPELLESLGLEGNHEILAVHSRLRDEAELALARARPSPRLQPRLLDDGGSGSWTGSAAAATGSLASLRRLRDRLLARIESCNSDLVSRLMERDSLHMEQDSLLVEIEDLTRRATDAAKQLRANDGAGSMGVRPMSRRVKL